MRKEGREQQRDTRRFRFIFQLARRSVFGGRKIDEKKEKRKKKKKEEENKMKMKTEKSTGKANESGIVFHV